LDFVFLLETLAPSSLAQKKIDKVQLAEGYEPILWRHVFNVPKLATDIANFKAGGQHPPSQQSERWLAFTQVRTVDLAKVPNATDLAMSGQHLGHEVPSLALDHLAVWPAVEARVGSAAAPVISQCGQLVPKENRGGAAIALDHAGVLREENRCWRIFDRITSPLESMPNL
jgi:hypothetical protein